MEAINHAEGEAAAIRKTSEATAEGIHMVAQALRSSGGMEAASLRVAEQYIEVWGGPGFRAVRACVVQ